MWCLLKAHNDHRFNNINWSVSRVLHEANAIDKAYCTRQTKQALGFSFLQPLQEVFPMHIFSVVIPQVLEPLEAITLALLSRCQAGYDTQLVGSNSLYWQSGASSVCLCWFTSTSSRSLGTTASTFWIAGDQSSQKSLIHQDQKRVKQNGWHTCQKKQGVLESQTLVFSLATH